MLQMKQSHTQINQIQRLYNSGTFYPVTVVIWKDLVNLHKLILKPMILLSETSTFSKMVIIFINIVIYFKKFESAKLGLYVIFIWFIDLVVSI